MPEFIVCAKSEVKKVAKQFEATHLVTAIDRGDNIFRPPRILPENHLNLRFEDEEDPNKFDAPTIHHAESILNFGQTLPDDAKVVVHCFAGVSRSTAMALALWLQANGTHKLDQAKAWLQEIRPRACPNMLLAHHFDKLLNLDGEFVKLCDQIGDESIARWWKNQESWWGEQE